MAGLWAGRDDGVAPDGDLMTGAVAAPAFDRAGVAQEVLPELGVGEDLLVRADDLEHGARGDEDQLAFGPAEGDGQPSRVEQERAGAAQVGRVALRRAEEDRRPLAALEALDRIDRRACLPALRVDGAERRDGVAQRRPLG